MRLTIDARVVFSSIDDEQEKKIISLCGGLSQTEAEFVRTLAEHNRKEELVVKALSYAKSLDFSKSNLKSDYLTHPIRVATYLLKMNPRIDPEYLAIALLHNVPEVTSISLSDLEQQFGHAVARGIGTLLVDRKKPFQTIKDRYYDALYEAGQQLMLVKLFDKMDNLLVLGLNPDEKARRLYLAEVREKLLPSAFSIHDSFGAYLSELLQEAELRGYDQNLRDWLNQHQKLVENNRRS